MRDWLGRHAPLDVLVVGGPHAIADAVVARLQSYDRDTTVERLAGDDRYDTAAAIALRQGPSARALIASGERAADATVAGPAANALGVPLLLTRALHAPAVTRDALRALAVRELVVVGGTAAISSDTAHALARACRPDPCTITRLAGHDRAATSVQFADWFLSQLDRLPNHVHLARGDVFADAVAGGPHAGRELAPILLTPDPRHLPDELRAWLFDHRATIDSIHILGDPQAVSSRVAAAARLAASR